MSDHRREEADLWGIWQLNWANWEGAGLRQDRACDRWSNLRPESCSSVLAGTERASVTGDAPEAANRAAAFLIDSVLPPLNQATQLRFHSNQVSLQLISRTNDGTRCCSVPLVALRRGEQRSPVFCESTGSWRKPALWEPAWKRGAPRPGRRWAGGGGGVLCSWENARRQHFHRLQKCI